MRRSRAASACQRNTAWGTSGWAAVCVPAGYLSRHTALESKNLISLWDTDQRLSKKLPTVQ